METWLSRETVPRSGSDSVAYSDLSLSKLCSSNLNKDNIISTSEGVVRFKLKYVKRWHMGSAQLV